MEQHLWESKCCMSLFAVISSVRICTLLSVTHVWVFSTSLHTCYLVFFLLLTLSSCQRDSGDKQKRLHSKPRLWWVGHLVRLRQEGRLHTSMRIQGIQDEERLWQTTDASWNRTLRCLYLLHELFVLFFDFSFRRYWEAALFIPWSVHSLQIQVLLNVNSFFLRGRCVLWSNSLIQEKEHFRSLYSAKLHCKSPEEKIKLQYFLTLLEHGVFPFIQVCHIFENAIMDKNPSQEYAGVWVCCSRRFALSGQSFNEERKTCQVLESVGPGSNSHLPLRTACLEQVPLSLSGLWSPYLYNRKMW